MVWRKSGSCGPAGRSYPLLRWCSTPACGMRAKSCSCPGAGAWAVASVRRRTQTCSTAWCRLPVQAENQSTDYIQAWKLLLYRKRMRKAIRIQFMRIVRRPINDLLFETIASNYNFRFLLPMIRYIAT